MKIYNKQTKGILAVNNLKKGESLMKKLQRIMQTGSGIEKIGQEGLIYNPDYDPGTDIRTDRFEVAINAMNRHDKLSKEVAEAALKKAADIETKNKLETQELEMLRAGVQNTEKQTV